MSQQPGKPRPTAATIPQKHAAVTVPTSAVPVELLRKYASPKPVKRCPHDPPAAKE